MSGTNGGTCPECGRTARHERDMLRTRRRRWLVVTALALLAIGQLGWNESRIRRGGWAAAVPTE
jgi:hypothetical protein